MANYWIVSAHEFMLHGSPESALTEANRLRKKLRKRFHVYRVKDKLVPGDEASGAAFTLEAPPAEAAE